jgi:hypothetical protein
VPLVPIAGSIAALVMVPQLEPRSLWLGGVLLALGLLVHGVLDRSSGAGPGAP